MGLWRSASRSSFWDGSPGERRRQERARAGKGSSSYAIRPHIGGGRLRKSSSEPRGTSGATPGICGRLAWEVGPVVPRRPAPRPEYAADWHGMLRFPGLLRR